MPDILDPATIYAENVSAGTFLMLLGCLMWYVSLTPSDVMYISQKNSLSSFTGAPEEVMLRGAYSFMLRIHRSQSEASRALKSGTGAAGRQQSRHQGAHPTEACVHAENRS